MDRPGIEEIEELEVFKYAVKLHAKGRSLPEIMEAIQIKKRYGDRIPDSLSQQLENRISSMYKTGDS